MPDQSRARFLPELYRELARIRLLFLIVVLYFAVAEILAWRLGAIDHLLFLLRTSSWIVWSIASVAVCLLLRGVGRSIQGGGSPFAHARDELFGRPQLAAGFALICAVSLFLATFTCIKNMLPQVTSYRYDQWLAELDRRMHGGVDPWTIIHPFVGHHIVTRILEALYYTGWLAALFVLSALVAMYPPLRHLRQQYFLTFFLCWIVLGNLCAGLFLSAGPTYFDEITGDVARFGALDQYLSFSEGLPNSAHALQRGLWDLYSNHQVALGSGISAFPSLHLSMATLFALLAWRIDKRFGFLMILYAGAIMIGSVHLSWHYAVDGYFSVLATIGLWALVDAALRRAARLRGPTVSAAGAVNTGAVAG